MASDTESKLNSSRRYFRAPVKPFPWRAYYRFALLQSFFILVAIGATGLAARYFFRKQFINQVKEQLQDTLVILSRNVPRAMTSEWCAHLGYGTTIRFTVVRAGGEVLCDSRVDARTMENHGGRPEVVSAWKNLFGQSVRYSETLKQEMVYGAIAIPAHQVVLRGALALTLLSSTMAVLDTSLGVVLLLIGAALTLCAFWSARTLVFPLGRLILKTQASAAGEDLSESGLRGDSGIYDEWEVLESNIDLMRRDLAAKVQSLRREQVEIDTIMGAISDAILAVDPEGSPLFYNSRFDLIFGTPALRERSVKLWSIFHDPEILAAFNNALKEGKRGVTKVIPLEQRGGLKSFFSLSVSPLRRHDGMIYGAVGIFHDVTELKSAEQMRIDFVANVSHELRTPLTAIKGYVDTLIDDVGHGKDTSPEFLNVIARNSERLLNLMNDLLNLSSIEAVDLLQKEAIATRELSERLIKQLQGNFEAKKQTIEAHYDTKTVYADLQRLEQVVVNLLDNASKYTPAGGGISISWETEGNDVLLKVEDTGPGIPVEHHSRLFERFYRVDKARSREQGGTGLGLAIVKHIMQRHEGAVSVESRPGHGSTFICRFPIPRVGS